MLEAIEKIEREIKEYQKIKEEAEERIRVLEAARSVLLGFVDSTSNGTKFVNDKLQKNSPPIQRGSITKMTKRLVQAMDGEIPVSVITYKVSAQLGKKVDSGSVSSVLRKMVKRGELKRVKKGVYSKF